MAACVAQAQQPLAAAAPGPAAPSSISSASSAPSFPSPQSAQAAQAAQAAQPAQPAQPAQAASSPRHPHLDAPAAPRDFDQLQLQFAQRLVAAHPDTSFTSRAPDRLLAIPVLEVELNADGSVRRIVVLRRPTTGREGDEATALAIAAVRRAAPYGNVAKLPKPWKLVETFLFNDALQFKPHTLDAE